MNGARMEDCVREAGIRDPIKNDLCYNRKFELHSLGSGGAIKIFKQQSNRMVLWISYFYKKTSL